MSSTRKVVALEAELATLRAAVVRVKAAFDALTDRMDRAGGDPHGMPECPWCKAGPDGDDHAVDCELVIARAAMADLAVEAK